MTVATVFTHRRPAETEPALDILQRVAREFDATLRLSPEETAKHGLVAAPGLELDAEVKRDVDLCFALGGDGTMLSALRAYAGTGVPVFGVNFGEIGFLATIEPDDPEAGFALAFRREFEVIALPGIAITCPTGDWMAMNDVSLHRQPGNRVADLSYGVADEEVGRVRCDGLVVSTPLGSTGYNLANGGPVMAWGVAGMVVSFVAPHSLTARALVVAPDDLLAIHNRSTEEPVDISVDGRPICALAPDGVAEVKFVNAQGCLAQLPGSSFYRRLHEKFGRLTSADRGKPA